MHSGLRVLQRGAAKAAAVPCVETDTIVEELDEFMRACRGDGEPEMDGEKSTASLAVILAGIQSAREGRRGMVAGLLARDGCWVFSFRWATRRGSRSARPSTFPGSF